MSQHPLPDLDAWAAVSDPDVRLRTALTEIYAYYAETEPMLTNLLRDLDIVEAVQRQFSGFLNYMEAARLTLMVGRRERGRGAQRARAAVGHGLALHHLAVAGARTGMHGQRGGRDDVPAGRPAHAETEAGAEQLGEPGPARPRDGRRGVTFGAAAVLSGCDGVAGAI